jgi:CubicO group peptidase (beta-lactamase class C family)
VAGRVIEAVTDQPYEDAVRSLLLEPLQLARTRFFTDQVAGYRIAGCHSVVDGHAVFAPDLWYFPRCGHPDSGLISSERDQLRFARFHLGDGRTTDGRSLLKPASLQAMRANAGPGGTLVAEIDGFGLSFGLRRTAEGVRVVIHGGSWPGQHSGFFFVPERDFAMTMLTNSDGGTQLRLDLFHDDWALQRFAGLRNPPAVPTRLSPERLADSEGRYVNTRLDDMGNWAEKAISVHGDDGALRGEVEQGSTVSEIGLVFYRGEYVLVEREDSGPPGSYRANFVRGADGRVAWLSYGGRLYERRD